MDILIVEDDRALCDTLADALSAQGLNVSQAYDGSEAVEMIMDHSYDILMLDINLPGINGFEVFAQAKRHYPSISALFMTALDTPEHIEKSFTSGGDDYIRKPFSIKELCFRLEAIYRRLYQLHSIEIAIGKDFKYCAATQTLTKNGEVLLLKPKLERLLNLLATHPARTMSREMIEERLWEGEDLPDTAILRIYIKELRQILGHDAITTFRGVGYRLETL
jgi:DNA-binding response OmpR family regulator